MEHFIITGASRGIGKETVLALAADNRYLHLIARSDMSELEEQIKHEGTEVRSYYYDLAIIDKLEELAEAIFDNIRDNSESVTLINNAGMLDPIGPVGKYGVSAFRQNLEMNYVSPLLLSHIFAKKTDNMDGKRCIVMITSGAAEFPLPGMSHYCSAKAGMNQFIRTLCAEQKGAKNPIRGLLFNPGKTDTVMQDEIRTKTQSDFPYLAEFVRSKREGELRDPAKVARKLVELLVNDNYENGAVVNLADP